MIYGIFLTLWVILGLWAGWYINTQVLNKDLKSKNIPALLMFSVFNPIVFVFWVVASRIFHMQNSNWWNKVVFKRRSC